LGTKIRLETSQAGLTTYISKVLEFPKKCMSCLNPVVEGEKCSVRSREGLDLSIKVPFCKKCKSQRSRAKSAIFLGGILSIATSIVVLAIIFYAGAYITTLIFGDEPQRTGVGIIDLWFGLSLCATSPSCIEELMYEGGFTSQVLIWGIIIFWFIPWWTAGTAYFTGLMRNPEVKRALSCVNMQADWLLVENEDYAQEIKGGIERQSF
jgi:hypothetical protein